jgi:hypothetical protein
VSEADRDQGRAEMVALRLRPEWMWQTDAATIPGRHSLHILRLSKPCESPSGKRRLLSHPKTRATDVARRVCTAAKAVLCLLAPSEAQRSHLGSWKDTEFFKSGVTAR